MQNQEVLIELRDECEKLVKLELNNSAIVILSILLEATLKELIKHKTKENIIKMRFNSAIDQCKSLELIDEKEFKWLKNVNSMVRNNYIHFNLDQLMTYLKLEGKEIPKHLVKKEFDKLLVTQFFNDVDEFLKDKLPYFK